MGVSPGSIYGSPTLGLYFLKRGDFYLGYGVRQTIGCDSVSSDLVQYKPSPYAYMNMPHLGMTYCWLVNTTACSVLDTAAY